MRPCGVEFELPIGKLGADLSQKIEQAFVQKAIALAGIDALSEDISD
tara:strand:+ start:14056 stop:14196 length:141 start_codon:yes stop_codon:yes gene_type:complete